MDKGFLTKTVPWRQFSGEKIIFSTNTASVIGYQFAKKVNIDLYLIPYKKINSKWISDLNVKPKTLILLEENIEYLCDLGLDEVFLNTTVKAQSIKFFKLINCTSKLRTAAF